MSPASKRRHTRRRAPHASRAVGNAVLGVDDRLRLRRSPDLVLTQVGLDELDRDTAVLDDGDAESLERAVRPEEYLLAFDRRVEVVHLEGYVGHRPEQRVERAAVLEAVVLDADPGRV